MLKGSVHIFLEYIRNIDLNNSDRTTGLFTDQQILEESSGLGKVAVMVRKIVVKLSSFVK